MVESTQRRQIRVSGAGVFTLEEGCCWSRRQVAIAAFDSNSIKDATAVRGFIEKLTIRPRSDRQRIDSARTRPRSSITYGNSSTACARLHRVAWTCAIGRPAWARARSRWPTGQDGPDAGTHGPGSDRAQRRWNGSASAFDAPSNADIDDGRRLVLRPKPLAYAGNKVTVPVVDRGPNVAGREILGLATKNDEAIVRRIRQIELELTDMDRKEIRERATPHPAVP